MPTDDPLGPLPPYDLTDRQVVRAIEHERHVQARKDFSQHWLVNRDVLDQIIQAAELTRQTTVLELGAGMGVLTAELARRAGHVVAVEIERGVVAILHKTVKRYDNVEIIAQDLLQFDPAAHFGDAPYSIVANLPYAVTSMAIRTFLEMAHPPTSMVLLVQFEVAERICAKPGDMSLLALSTQWYSTPRIIARVPARSFMPPPEVDSAIIRLDLHPPPVTGEVRDRLFAIARVAFSQRRKQLHNVLPAGLHLSAAQVQAWLAAAEIAPDRRPQTLSIPEWVKLAEIDPFKLPVH